MANRNYLSQKMFSGHAMPVHIDAHFTVAASDAAGLGVTSLTGAYVQNVFMHTSATPGVGNSNPSTPGITITNPNPANGLILIQLQDTYSYLYEATVMVTSPSSGSSLKVDNAALTPGAAYTITTLGNASAAQWQLIGVPAGVTPAVGVNFICTNAGGSANTSTSRVQATADSGVFKAELVPTANADLAPSIAAQGSGAQLIIQLKDASGALVAPAAGSAIRVSLLLSNSSVTVQGS